MIGSPVLHVFLKPSLTTAGHCNLLLPSIQFICQPLYWLISYCSLSLCDSRIFSMTCCLRPLPFPLVSSSQSINMKVSSDNRPIVWAKSFPYRFICFTYPLSWPSCPLPRGVGNTPWHSLVLALGASLSCFYSMLAPASVHTLTIHFQAPPLAPLSLSSPYILIFPRVHLFLTFIPCDFYHLFQYLKDADSS